MALTQVPANMTTGTADSTKGMSVDSGKVGIDLDSSQGLYFESGQLQQAAAAAGGAWTVVAAADADSGTATIDFTNALDSTYKVYVFVCSRITLVNDGQTLAMKTGDSAGSFDSASGRYVFHQADLSAASASYAAKVDGGSYGNWNLDNAIGNDSGEHANFIIYCYGFSDSVSRSMIQWQGIETTSAPETLYVQGGGTKDSAATRDRSVRFNGGINPLKSGNITLYGIKDS